MYMAQSLRGWFGIGFMACVGILVAGLLFEFVGGYEPCPMCMMQRLIYLSIAVFCLLGMLSGPQRRSLTLIAGFGVLVLGVFGTVQATRQLYLQSIPADMRPPTCGGMSIYYMADAFPLVETITVMLKGSGDCGTVNWRGLGLSIPGWSLVLFLCFALLGLLTLFVRRR
jgi:disulfide bond formation protein DsbB